MITLSSKSFAETLYYSGTYDTEGIDSTEYEFTLIVNMSDEVEAFSMEIQWINDTPENQEEAEKEIKQKYLER
jgi:hypothetical protein